VNGKDLSGWFETVRETLETAYLQHPEPWRQSGFSGPDERWIAARKPIADCIDRSGTFLDIGCANGYLLECVRKWTAERGLKVVPYGLDISAKLVELARARLPQFSDNIYAGNSWDWVPPRRFDFVRTELVYVPGELQTEYVNRLLSEIVSAGGSLLVAEYRSRSQPADHTSYEQTLHGKGGDAIVFQPAPVEAALEGWGFRVSKVVSGYYEGKEVTRVGLVKR
jgi:SAM-dependent methyltransferase